MKKRLFKYIFIFILFFLVGSVITISLEYSKGLKEVDVNTVLKTEAYSYLPDSAKEYIKDSYIKTGEVIYTEKNKQTNKLYLNPLYVAYLESSEEEKEELGEIPVPLIVDYAVTDIENASYPSSYNLRNVGGKNYVTPVRNQGSLGICWAFASSGAAESYLLLKNNTSYSSSSRLIAERQMDYATATNGIKDYDSEYISFVERELGDGGNFFISSIIMASGISLIDYNNFKAFDDTDFSKMELADVLSYDKSLYEVNSTINMPTLSLRASTDNLSSSDLQTRDNYINTVKQNIMNYGAAYVGTIMDNSCQYYDSNLNNLVIDVYSCNAVGGHAMEIIGWNDNYQYSYCADNSVHKASTTNCSNVVSGQGVWILKNSWGDYYPYPYLTYDSLNSSIHFITNLSSNSNKNWDNEYLIGAGELGYYTRTYSLMGTKIRSNETVKKIKFMSFTSNASYTIRVKKTDGTYATVSKSVALPGLVTMDIPSGTIVDSSSTVTITSSDGVFLDKVMVFTSNIDTTPFIDTESLNNGTVYGSSSRFYSETKNIPSASTITYKFYDSSNVDVSNKVTVTNNIVAENNINPIFSFSDSIEGKYKVNAVYNSDVIGTFYVNVIRMSGKGTAEQPYIITSPQQLSQIRNNLSAYYELGNDIDLTESTRDGGILSLPSDTCPQGFGWESINGFNGSLDGKGHTIKGLYQKNYLYCVVNGQQWWTWNDDGNGLFSEVRGNATIKNLFLEDFDITCHSGYCGALVSYYVSNLDGNGAHNNSDTTQYSANFSNIAIMNSRVGSGGDESVYGGGLFAYLESTYGNININGIYLDIKRDLKDFDNDGYLINKIQAKSANISNIHATGDIVGKYADGSANSVLINTVYANNTITINNILSTVTAKNVMSNLIGYVWGNNLALSNVNILNNENKPLCSNNNCSSVTNVKMFDKNTQIGEFTKSSNYSTWSNFNNNWEIKTVNGITRIPILKFMSYDYTDIANITLNHELNSSVNIFDYLTPQTELAKRIIYGSNDESIVIVTEDGNLIPRKSGQTTIHVESLYDGYIKNVPITVNYTPHYTVHFDANGGTGTMDDTEVAVGQNYTLPANVFAKNDFEFKEWNTKADGTGTSYANLAQIPAMNDKEEITLYAIWIGEAHTVTFNANGGTVNLSSKVVRVGEKYGELPIPSRANHGFTGWYCNEVVVDSEDTLLCDNLIARWQENAFTVIYDANGGSLSNNYSGDYNFVSNTEFTDIGLLNFTSIRDVPFVKENLYFKEWNTKADGTGQKYHPTDSVNIDNIENSMVYLYAVWDTVPNNYIIHFNANGGTGTMNNYNYSIEETGKLPKNTFTKNNYSFEKWCTNSDGTGTCLDDEATVTNLFGTNEYEKTLYAIWNCNYTNYTIHFNANGGTGTMNDYSYLITGTGTLPANTFTKNDYTFKKWCTNSDGTGTCFNDKATVANLFGTDEFEKTLYAIWEKNTTGVVTFNSNYGSNNVVTQNFTFNQNFKLKKNTFVRNNYLFKGWNTRSDGNGTTYNDEQTVNFNQSLTLYAIWEENTTGIITYNSNFGSNSAITHSFTFNQYFKLQKNTFVRNDYRFKGWNTRSDGTGTAYSDEQRVKFSQNVTLYAMWQMVNRYSLTMNVVGGNGTVSPSGQVLIFEGRSQSVTFSPRGGYTIKSLKIDNIEQTTSGVSRSRFVNNGYTFNYVTSSHYLTVTFGIDSDGNGIPDDEEIKEVVVYRMYNPVNGEHLYTTDAHEVDVIYREQGWGKEGIGWFTANKGTPVYRLFNPRSGSHLYTSDTYEIRIITTFQGWVLDFDGKPVMYSSGDVPIYRLFNPGLKGQHHLTTDRNEYNIIPKWGWQQEGIAMYALRAGVPEQTHYYR